MWVELTHKPPRVPLHRFVAKLAGPDPHEPVKLDGPNLAVSDLARLGRVGDQIDELFELAGLDEYLDLDLRYELHLVLGATEDLALSALAAVALDLGNGEAEYTGVAEGLFHLFELEGFDDGGDQVRHVVLLARSATDPTVTGSSM